MSNYNLKLVLSFFLGLQLTFSQNAPVANNDSYEVERNTILNDDSPGVLANDSDPDDNSLFVVSFTINGLNYSADNTTRITEGVFTLNENGSFVFEPVQDFLGNFPTVSYTISDGAFTATATLNITVILPPIAPIANKIYLLLSKIQH